MSPVIVTGVVIVNLALVCYGVGVITEQRSRRVSRRTLDWLRVGVVLDLTATSFMIVGSSRGPFTLHALLGFSSLTAMVFETGFAWRHRSRSGDGPVPRWLHLFSRCAYGWWLVAYATGAYLVMAAR